MLLGAASPNDDLVQPNRSVQDVVVVTTRRIDVSRRNRIGAVDIDPVFAEDVAVQQRPPNADQGVAVKRLQVDQDLRQATVLLVGTGERHLVGIGARRTLATPRRGRFGSIRRTGSGPGLARPDPHLTVREGVALGGTERDRSAGGRNANQLVEAASRLDPYLRNLTTLLRGDGHVVLAGCSRFTRCLDGHQVSGSLAGNLLRLGLANLPVGGEHNPGLVLLASSHTALGRSRPSRIGGGTGRREHKKCAQNQPSDEAQHGAPPTFLCRAHPGSSLVLSGFATKAKEHYYYTLL